MIKGSESARLCKPRLAVYGLSNRLAKPVIFATFIGSPKMNFVPTVVTKAGESTLQLETYDGQSLTIPGNYLNLTSGTSLMLGIRPEHIEVDSTMPIALDFQSEVVERLGNSTYLFGQTAGIDGFKIHLTGDCEVDKFSKIKVGFAPNRVHLFDDQGLRVSQIV